MRRQASAAQNDLEHMLSHENEQPRALPLSLLENITDDFSENHRIGSGGFAVVYKGKLENGIVAVKKLSERLEISDDKFKDEVRCLMKVKHKNIVRFLGYCANIQGEMVGYNGDFVMADVRQRLLCFEYVPKGNLDEYMKDASCGLDWIKSYQIIKGICEGLHYLHQNHIVHLDLKPANILLDDNLVPKITDFGLSRCFDEKQSRAITKNMSGTWGYMPPEFHSGDVCIITYKSDIYSLGVVIMEMLTGKKWYPAYPDIDDVLESWRNKLRESQWGMQLKQIRLCTEIGIECLDVNRANRPDTSHIIDRLGETEDKCIITGMTYSTIALENMEDATNNLLFRRNNDHLMNESAKKNVIVGQGIAKNLRAGQECLNVNLHIVEVESGPSMSANDCNLQEAKEFLNGDLHIVAAEYALSISTEDRNLQEALQFIKDDPVGVIGIWGPGGVGKTHLLNNIKNALDGDMTFNYVVQVTASRGCSVEKIRTDIARQLDLKYDGNVQSQCHAIFDFLKKRSFLVLLDDLWDQIDLQAVGIPYPLGSIDQIRRKVVITTRSRKVCGQMEVRKECKVACLQEEESWQLFQDKVGHETLSYSPRIDALARELVMEMKGLPLALITIAKAMYAKFDTAEWEYAIQHMKRTCCDNDDPLDMERVVFSQVKFSFDCLRNNTLRDCFLTCALWPENQMIPKVELAKCWIGLGLVFESDIQSSYTKAYSLIGELLASCLLDGCGKLYDFVKMHDVVRDMALWISSGCSENNGKWFVRAGVGPDQKFSIPWNQVRCISLVQNRLLEFPPVDSNPHYMRILCLGNNMLHESIIAGEIKKFASLTYLDLRFNRLSSIPEELCSLANLEHLDLSDNLDVDEVPHCFGNLIKLKFLYLESTSIQRIPERVISSLKALQVIDFRTDFFSPVPKELLSRMLQELGTIPHLKAVGIIVEYNILQLREGNYLPIRYLNLRGLETHALNFSDILSHDFARRNLYELRIQMCKMKEIILSQELAQPSCCFGTLNQLLLFHLSDLREIIWMKTSPTSLFPRLACLTVLFCGKLNDLSWAMYLPCLEQLIIGGCSLMQQTFLSDRGDNKCSEQNSSKTFPCLKYLRISRCVSLVNIGDPDVTFPSLERLELDDCQELKRLPFRTNSLPRKLQVLEIDVKSWERLELEECAKSFLQHRLEIVEDIP
ncbi:probable disease resistance protein At1g61300 isoform X1 [Hordeum vulgare subsp. vulgare]|uniref:Protein kinase domain-containing protein n=2 Tax=Hordeum vulgare subsp. vulgare TaxID=112509 RepID=A0A8I6YLZ0_HORVV|nr:probable disease resistance protein At1g61300 isoform X1 [Hordeum vulgare subsp. vulgare]XP_044985747.1 probable disease resistance protein At1g61300 isoform X1 [Hordeum vulgare subsp. vulgare]